MTGATGFIGHHVAKLLVQRGELIRVTWRAASRRDNIDCLDPNLVQAVEADLTDDESLRRALEGVETLYHVAADYRLWAKDPQELYRANVDGTRSLLQIAKECGVGKVVYTSTVWSVRNSARRLLGHGDNPGFRVEYDRELQTFQISGGAASPSNLRRADCRS